MKKHINIKISGQVQGVLFRVTAKEKADKLGITGFARNEPDGSVYIEAEGEEKTLDQFLDWCHKGPQSAQVEKVIVSEGQLKKFTSFEVN